MNRFVLRSLGVALLVLIPVAVSGYIFYRTGVIAEKLVGGPDTGPIWFFVFAGIVITFLSLIPLALHWLIWGLAIIGIKLIEPSTPEIDREIEMVEEV